MILFVILLETAKNLWLRICINHLLLIYMNTFAVNKFVHLPFYI